MLKTQFDQISFLPFPHGFIDEFIEPSTFEILRDTFPALDVAEDQEYLGNKRSLSQTNNSDGYWKHLKSNKEWMDLHKELKGGMFIKAITETLKDEGIDLRCRDYIKGTGIQYDLINTLKQLKRGSIPKWISTRFEYSIMPANGGCILPHTDHPNKILTMVVGFNKEHELHTIEDAELKLCEPKDSTKSYNQVNNYLEFDAINVLEKVLPSPNRAVMFIKTHNSLHCVGPMVGPSGVFRKTLTINVELKR